jgi:tight adherence protein B
VRTVTAEGRLSAVVLIGLPIVLGVLLAFVNPEYMSELTHGTGLWLVAAGGVLLLIGGVWVSRLVKVKY